MVVFPIWAMIFLRPSNLSSVKSSPTLCGVRPGRMARAKGRCLVFLMRLFIVTSLGRFKLLLLLTVRAVRGIGEEDCESIEQSRLDHRCERADWKLSCPERAAICPALAGARVGARPA